MNQDARDPASGSGRSITAAEHATPRRQTDDEPAAGPAPSCFECQSSLVRPSRSAYPLDEAKRKGGDGSFWRCDNCGVRFLGPAAPQRKRRRHGRGGARDSEDGLTRGVKLSRAIKRVMFPIIVMISTIVAVIYILDRRSEQAEEHVIFPE